MEFVHDSNCVFFSFLDFLLMDPSPYYLPVAGVILLGARTLQ